nr:hypothetical protein [Mycoplasmopsis bovis]
MNTEHNRAKNKTGFGIPKYFKNENFWNSDKIKTIRPHELGTGFISKKTESQVYDADTASRKIESFRVLLLFGNT